MRTHNTAGIKYIKINEVKDGDVIIADDDFTCMKAGPTTVMKNSQGLFVACKDGGHWLDGQCDDGIHCVGFTKK